MNVLRVIPVFALLSACQASPPPDAERSYRPPPHYQLRHADTPATPRMDERHEHELRHIDDELKRLRDKLLPPQDQTDY